MNDEEKKAADKKAEAKKAEEKKAADKKAEAKKAEEKAAADKKEAIKNAAAAGKKVAGKYVGKEVSIGQANGADFKGLCKAVRDTGSGAQVFLKLNSSVSRWFNIKDIVE